MGLLIIKDCPTRHGAYWAACRFCENRLTDYEVIGPRGGHHLCHACAKDIWKAMEERRVRQLDQRPVEEYREGQWRG